MAYSLYIERDDPIPFSEFSAAVQKISDLRIVTGDIIGVNPRTREKIRIKSEGAAQIYDSEDQVWLREFEFKNGKVSWRATSDWETWHLKKHALKLAKLLNGKIVGDEGEEYT